MFFVETILGRNLMDEDTWKHKLANRHNLPDKSLFKEGKIKQNGTNSFYRFGLATLFTKMLLDFLP
jgi:hypothetical protein